MHTTSLRAGIRWVRTHGVIAVCTLSFVGYAFALEVRIPFWISVTLLGVGVLGIIACRRTPRVALYVIPLVLGICFLRTELQHTAPNLNQFFDTPVSLIGVIDSVPEDRGANVRYVVRVSEITGSSVSGRVLLYEVKPSRCAVGESVRAHVTLQRPESFVTHTGRLFAYEHYLRAKDIHAIAFVSEKEKETSEAFSCESQGEQTLLQHLSMLRSYVITRIARFIPEPESSLLSGLLIGTRGALGEETLEAFRLTGLTHIIVLSGYNVMVVAEAVRRLLRRVPRRFGLYIACIVVVLFVLFSGAEVPAVRAGSMTLIALAAQAFHRTYDGIRILFLVGAVMAFLNPHTLLYDVSFHLSFLATLGLLLYTPLVERMFSWVPATLQIRSVCAATVSVQLFLLPYIIYQIGEVSLIALLANLFVLPLVPLAMAGGFLLISIASIAPLLAIPVSAVTYVVLYSIVQIATLLSQVPFAALVLPSISITGLAVGYALLFLFLWYSGARSMKKHSLFS